MYIHINKFAYQTSQGSFAGGCILFVYLIYIHTHICTYVHIHVCMYNTYICVYIYMCIYIYTNSHTSLLEIISLTVVFFLNILIYLSPCRRFEHVLLILRNTFSRVICCSVLQCVAVCCSVLQQLQCSTMRMRLTLRNIFSWVSITSEYLCCVNQGICCSVVQRVAARCSALQRAAVRCSALQCAAVRCTLQPTITTYNTLKCNSLQLTATHCDTLQLTATHCNTLQHTATHQCLDSLLELLRFSDVLDNCMKVVAVAL